MPSVSPAGDPVDPDALDRARTAALSEAQRLGATHAELRIERIRSQMVRLRDGSVETAADDDEVGMGLRVLYEGSIGFAATVAVTAGGGRRTGRPGRGGGPGGGRRPAPTGRAGRRARARHDHWSSGHRIDPVAVPLADKVALLEGWSRRLLDARSVDHVTASVLAVTEDKHYADLAGTVADQRRVRVHPQVEAIALEPSGAGFETMRTVAPPVGRGWEYLEGDGWDWEAELGRLPELLAGKLAAPSVEPGRYDLVIDPTNLWLTIHESIGHATELDRAMGYEAAYAGTSFATFDKLGSLRYGSEVMHVTGDRTAEHGLATVAIDDEGVAAQSFDLVRDGVLAGYQLDRSIAAASGLGRSNGCAFADSPLHVPIQRMANVSLQPAPGEGPSTEELIAGVERGIFIVGDKSWSIDMQRYNFQFTGQRFFRIEHGRLAGQLRDVAYQATTTDFWGVDGGGGRSVDLPAGRGLQLRQGPAGPGGPGEPRLPLGPRARRNVLNARAEAGR